MVRWPAESTKCKDLFKGTSLAPHKNHNFTSSYKSYDQRERSTDGGGRPTKRRKGNDGSALPDAENVEAAAAEQ